MCVYHGYHPHDKDKDCTKFSSVLSLSKWKTKTNRKRKMMTKTLISRQARVLTRTIVSGFGQLQLVMVMARTATEQNRLKAHSSRSPAVPLSNSWGKYTPINKCAKINICLNFSKSKSSRGVLSALTQSPSCGVYVAPTPATAIFSPLIVVYVYLIRFLSILL